MADQMMQHKADELAAKQTIPAGFKWTEIGIIPEDWIIEKLGMYASFRTGPFGSALHKSDYVIDGIPIVNPMQIIDGGIIPTSSMSISTTAATKLSEFRLQTGDIVIGRRGEMGRCAVVGIEENGWLCGTGSMIIRIKSSCESRFIQRVLSSKEIIAAIESSSVGTTMINLNQSTLRELKIFIPSNKSEQLAIATVLSDTDALISGLEQLIAKKQAIKIATMQQLLTGRTRLPAFALRPDGTPKGYKSSELGQIPEDWEALAIDDCATKVGSGKTPNGGASVYIDAGRPFVRSQNIGWGRLILDDVAYISDDIHNTFSGSEIKEDDVLLNITGASIGRCAITEGYIVGGNVNQHVCIIRLNSVLLNARLLVELIISRNGQKQIDSYQAGGNREGLNFQQVRQLKFAVSNSSVEQTAIATILSDMDSELTALEQKLAKARSLKQGMMQQLLTGRIRLPLPKEA